jgi:hypothetical protein
MAILYVYFMFYDNVPKPNPNFPKSGQARPSLSQIFPRKRLGLPCQPLFFLRQFQRVKLQTISFAAPCRNAVATFLLRTSSPSFRAVSGHSRTAKAVANILIPEISEARGEVYVETGIEATVARNSYLLHYDAGRG